MKQNPISEYMRLIGRKGGLKTLKKYGKKHFSRMRSIVKSTKKGGVDK